ncbi:MAG TPA: histidine kinase, partial [Chitinophagaceae bacterium]|nr:histidine kinase [Chitinophagaceae bacterium]
SAQNLSFSHLNTSNGLLSDQRMQITEDRLGRLWLATDEGINVFDGYEVASYTQYDRSGIGNNRITSIFCDKKGTIWIGNPAGVQYKKENSNVFITLPIDSNTTALDRIFLIKEVKSGIIAFARDSCFLIDEQMRVKPLLKLTAIIKKNASMLTAALVHDDVMLLGIRSETLMVDVGKEELIKKLPYSNAWTFCRINDKEWLAGCFAAPAVSIMNIETGTMERINDWPTQNGGKVVGYAGEIADCGNGKFAIACRYSGLYMVDVNAKNAVQYRSDAGDHASLTSDNNRRVFVTRNRTIVVQGTGISYTSLDQPSFGVVKRFSDNKGEKYQNVVNCFIQDEDKNMWIGTNSHLLKWDRKTGTSTYYPFYEKDNDGPINVRTIRTVTIDSKKRIWAGAFSSGLALLQADGNYRNVRPTFDNHPDSIPLSTEYLGITTDRHGNFLIGTGQRMFLFDPVTEKVETFRRHPKLKKIHNIGTFRFIADRDDNWWFAQMRGLSYYNKKEDSLYRIPLPTSPSRASADRTRITDHTIIGLAEDSSGAIYAGGYNGVHIIKPGEHVVSRTLGKADGLESEYISGLLCDQSGKMWIIGNRGLARYDPVNGSIQTFDAKDGVIQANHKESSYYLAPDGEIFIGTEAGFNHFYPSNLRVTEYPLNVFITGVQAPDTLINTLSSGSIVFPHNENTLVFQYLTVDFKLANFIQYRYKLEGFDTGYVYAGKQRQARYTNLQAGKYTFIVEASSNGKDWYKTNNPVGFTIRKAFWKTWWFRVTVIALLVAIAYSFYRYRINRINKEARLRSDYEIKLNELENSALRTQMNPHFIFNSLNTINSFVNSNDRVQANQYISKFSKLVRLILDHSREKKIVLKDELEVAELYMQLEQIRFEGKFSFSINVSGVDSSVTDVPPLIIQPFVENAILHGLLPLDRPGVLKIDVKKEGDLLLCSIEDNGIGREAAKMLKQRSGYNRKSHGMEITLKRIELFNKEHKQQLPVDILDLKDDKGEAAGTRVIIMLPYVESF